jgi:hypothetical protein
VQSLSLAHGRPLPAFHSPSLQVPAVIPVDVPELFPVLLAPGVLLELEALIVDDD